MRYLGQGKEGKAAVYVDTESGKSVVVKTYFGHGSNILPLELVDVLGDYTLQWPNEIEAGLLIGNTKAGEQQYFVPVVDLFVLQAQDRSWHWALVTPFIEGGTLLDLASHIRSTRRSTAMELDQEFRPVLHGALEALVQLHGKGYCHNDIKTDNLFVLGNNHWLLGDLGQVRQSSHPWHGTKTWRERNQWSDCHLNDVRRLLKSYMTFLREAGADWQAFDQAFSHGEEAWSRLYWSWMALPTPANGTIVLSHQVGPEMWLKEAGTRHNMGMCLKRGVERELKCTSTQLHWYEYLSYWRC
jgi:serine/threonine protein kinase